MVSLVKNETCFVMRSEEVIIAVVIAIEAFAKSARKMFSGLQRDWNPRPLR